MSSVQIQQCLAAPDLKESFSSILTLANGLNDRQRVKLYERILDAQVEKTVAVYKEFRKQFFPIQTALSNFLENFEKDRFVDLEYGKRSEQKTWEFLDSHPLPKLALRLPGDFVEQKTNMLNEAGRLQTLSCLLSLKYSSKALEKVRAEVENSDIYKTPESFFVIVSEREKYSQAQQFVKEEARGLCDLCPTLQQRHQELFDETHEGSPKSQKELLALLSKAECLIRDFKDIPEKLEKLHGHLQQLSVLTKSVNWNELYKAPDVRSMGVRQRGCERMRDQIQEALNRDQETGQPQLVYPKLNPEEPKVEKPASSCCVLQ